MKSFCRSGGDTGAGTLSGVKQAAGVRQGEGTLLYFTEILTLTQLPLDVAAHQECVPDGRRTFTVREELENLSQEISDLVRPLH